MKSNAELLKSINLKVLLFCCITFGSLQSQTNMPDNSYSIIIEAAGLCATQPRKAMEMLRPIKQTFKVKGSFENIDDFRVYNTLISTENTIHSLKGQYGPIYRNLGEIINKIKPLRDKDDEYASIYFFSKLYILTYKAQEKGGMLMGNSRYRGDIQVLIGEAKKFEFKEAVNQNLVISFLERYL